MIHPTKLGSDAAQCAKSTPSSDGHDEEYDFQDYEGGICLDSDDETQLIIDETNDYYGLLWWREKLDLTAVRLDADQQKKILEDTIGSPQIIPQFW